MSKVQAMLADQALAVTNDARPASGRPVRPVGKSVRPAASLWRWVRQRDVPSSRTWRPQWLLGLVEVVTHPLPRWRAQRMILVPGCRAIPGFPAREPFWVAA